MKTMLEYCKLILEKVSFDKSLFNRELFKALVQIEPDDLPNFKEWCYRKFAEQYADILDWTFSHFNQENKADASYFLYGQLS